MCCKAFLDIPLKKDFCILPQLAGSLHSTYCMKDTKGSANLCIDKHFFQGLLKVTFNGVKINAVRTIS